jgi:two-component system, NtrC family, sensor histidine kinase PilS
MTFQASSPAPPRESTAPFLPLAFRLFLSFGLAVLHLALPQDGPPPRGESIYLILLALLFAESVWEALRAEARMGRPFAQPGRGCIRLNLLLDLALVTLIVAFHGVDQERLGTIYIFPVLASAFYLNVAGIVGVGLASSACHIICVFLFSFGVLPPFGHSEPGVASEPYQLAHILGFASLQIFGATLVVLVIRSHMENLSSNLSRTEAAVGEISELYRRVFDSMFSGLITTDLEGRITSANPAAEKILGATLRQGSRIMDYGFEDPEKLGIQAREQRFEIRFRPPDGSVRIVGGNVAPLRGPVDAPTGHLLVFQDLTEIKALEERTRLSERLAAVGELSSSMAHELRNPLASILGCVQLLRQGGNPPEMVDRVLNILRRESERVSVLVTDFLDFTRPRPMRVQPVELRMLTEELRASWETDPRRGHLVLEMAAPPEGEVLADPVCAHQVFTNLLSNARKALKGAAAPSLKVDFRPEGDHVLAQVADNGCGMSEEQLKTIFIPFSSGFEEGTGLGMSLVFQFVQRMGWSIQVESVPGSGTTVSLKIPRVPGTFGALGRDHY